MSEQALRDSVTSGNRHEQSEMAERTVSSWTQRREAMDRNLQIIKKFLYIMGV